MTIVKLMMEAIYVGMEKCKKVIDNWNLF